MVKLRDFRSVALWALLSSAPRPRTERDLSIRLAEVGAPPRSVARVVIS